MITPLWLTQALENPEITDILLNGAESCFIDRGNGLEALAKSPWNTDELLSWVLEQITSVGRTWDARHPFVDATLTTGHRLHAAFPPLARQGLLVSLRRLPEASKNTAVTADDRCQSRWKTTPQSASCFEILRSACIRGESIVLSGATGSGKTTLARDLLSSVPTHERILALEDTAELAPTHPHFISLISRPPNADGCGEVTLRTLLRQALRMRPDRIVLGECRGPEVLDLLQAMNTGHQGLLTTLHANSPRDALRRIELLCLLSGNPLPQRVIRELLAHGVQWIAQVKRLGQVRVITELSRVEGIEGETILLRNTNHSIHPS